MTLAAGIFIANNVGTVLAKETDKETGRFVPTFSAPVPAPAPAPNVVYKIPPPYYPHPHPQPPQQCFCPPGPPGPPGLPGPPGPSGEHCFKVCILHYFYFILFLCRLKGKTRLSRTERRPRIKGRQRTLWSSRVAGTSGSNRTSRLSRWQEVAGTSANLSTSTSYNNTFSYSTSP